MLVPLSMLGGNMMCVVLPCKDEGKVQALQKFLDQVHNVFIVFGSVLDRVSGEKILFTRLSSQIYLQLSDFERLASLVLMFFSSTS